MNKISKDHHSYKQGHRKRLREKFLLSGLSGFNDYEIIELLLTLGTPRKDCKPMAKELIVKFGSLNAVLDAPIEELMKIKGVGSSNIFGLKLLPAISEIYQRESVEQSLTLTSPESIFKYLREKIGIAKKEHFVVLFFDTQNKLIVDDVSVGTLNASLVHPREVFKKAIRSSASHVVIAHNHPSGDCTPSQEDIDITKRLIKAGEIIGITIVDHLIVSKKGYISLRNKLTDFK